MAEPQQKKKPLYSFGNAGFSSDFIYSLRCELVLLTYSDMISVHVNRKSVKLYEFTTEIASYHSLVRTNAYKFTNVCHTHTVHIMYNRYYWPNPALCSQQTMLLFVWHFDNKHWFVFIDNWIPFSQRLWIPKFILVDTKFTSNSVCIHFKSIDIASVWQVEFVPGL